MSAAAVVGSIVVAAGTGERLGAGGPKALVELDGRPLIAHALAGLAAAGLPPAVVVHPPGEEAAFRAALRDTPAGALVPGGATRTLSVAAGLEALTEEVDVVAVHDAARPLTPPAVIAAVLAAVTGQDDVLGVAPALPVSDTVKRTDAGEVTGTVDRTGLVQVQTPQAFPRRVLVEALTGAGEATDDLGLVEAARAAGRCQGRLMVVPGSVWGRKVTYPGDLALLEVLAQHAAPDALDRTRPVAAR